MYAGHSVKEALAFASRFPSWQDAKAETLTAFSSATAALWREIAEVDQTPWKSRMAEQAATLARIGRKAT